MVSESRGLGGQPRQAGRARARAGSWQEMLAEYPAIRQVFHALCAMSTDEDAGELLEFAARQEWMTEVARRVASVARFEYTMPSEPEDEELNGTLWELYAASRVRDVLLLAHQPGPVSDPVRELDEALHREQPLFRTVPVDQITGFFTAIGCQPVTEASFDPILHEIITCEAADHPATPIQITGQCWPALMIGELVFTRAGVRVRAGSAHAVPGIADRSELHWEYWRRHRITSDGSFWWGHNSQWRTAPRRDYLTSSGHVYDYDAFSSFNRLMPPLPGGNTGPLTADQASFIKNRCQLRTSDEPDFQYLNRGIDETRY